MKTSDLIFSLSNLLKTNKGFFKSEKQAKFLLNFAFDNEVVNHFNTYGHAARDHYHLDDKGVYKIERYTDKKGYVTTWERGQIHSLEVAKNRDDVIRSQIEKTQVATFGYTIESKDFYSFIDLFNTLETSNIRLKTLLTLKDDDEILAYLDSYEAYVSAVAAFKEKYFSCTL